MMQAAEGHVSAGPCVVLEVGRQVWREEGGVSVKPRRMPGPLW